jgi:seryl-tRNA synthetase
MLDKNFILNNPKNFLESLRTKTSDQNTLEKAEKLFSIVKKRRELSSNVDSLKASFKKNTSEFQKKIKALSEAELLSEKEDLILQKDNIKKQVEILDALQIEEESLLLEIPNLPHHTSPVGQSDSDNPVVRYFLKEECVKKPLTHEKVGGKLLASDDAVNLSGSRFMVLHKELAKLERSLINFFLDLHSKNNYDEVMVPYIVTREVMTGTGQLPKFEEDLFSLKTQLSNQDAFLIPTAEVPVTNIYRNKILEENLFPIKHCCFSPCFRAEAGSAGRDTKGLIRLHQFHKVELVILSLPETSMQILEEITSDAESCLKHLEIPYRVVERCTADLGFGGYKGYDIEVWMAGQDTYREISSCTNFSDFQARRAKIRYKDSAGKNIYVHTLNASGLAIGRTMAAILEFYQEDGNVKIPDSLVPYYGKEYLF